MYNQYVQEYQLKRLIVKQINQFFFLLNKMVFIKLYLEN